MSAHFFEEDVRKAVEVLRNGGTILYPTDTVWGLGCDATNLDAVAKLFRIKKRGDHKSMIVLVADERTILQYVAAPDLAVFHFLEEQSRPTTIIYPLAVGLPDDLVAPDGSVAIRIVQDDFCRHLIKRLRKPIISTSANISGQQPPAIFTEVSDEVKKEVDYVVQWRQDDEKRAIPSRIVKWYADGRRTVIRP